MARTAPSQISFADWEFVRQKISLEPMLQAISDFMDGQARLVEKVRRASSRRWYGKRGVAYCKTASFPKKSTSAFGGPGYEQGVDFKPRWLLEVLSNGSIGRLPM